MCCEALEFAAGHEETIAKVYWNYKMGNHRHETGIEELWLFNQSSFQLRDIECNTKILVCSISPLSCLQHATK